MRRRLFVDVYAFAEMSIRHFASKGSLHNALHFPVLYFSIDAVVGTDTLRFVERRMKQLSMGLQDALMLWADAPARPLHVGGYFICAPPSDAGSNFVHELVTTLRQYPIDVSPWNYCIARGVEQKSLQLPSWEIARKADPRYHIVHHALEGRATLDDLISRLHSERLDMTRPLWQYHVIEGLPDQRFAVYHKVHHALIDGFLGMRSFVRSTADDAAASVCPLWSSGRKRVNGRDRARLIRTANAPELASAPDGAPRIAHLLLDLGAAIPELVEALGRMITAAAAEAPQLIVPCTAPHSPFNAPISSRRCVATLSLELQAVKTVARKHAATVNDVLLWICGSALRRYLSAKRLLPSAPLIALVPVALNRSDDEASGNKLGVVYASLATHLPRAPAGLNSVARSMQAGKAHLLALPDSVRGAYCVMSLLPALMNLWAPALVKPSANVVVSSMHGPERKRYFNHAVVEAIYPLSTIVSGMALNITCVRYCEHLSLGLVACPDVVPDLVQLVAFLSEAADELQRRPRKQLTQPRRRHTAVTVRGRL